MSENELYNLTNKALLYYDTKNETYKNYIKSTNIKVSREDGTVEFKDVNEKKNKFNYQILGIFDNDKSIWMWGWMIPELIEKETEIVKKLLYYGLKITPDNKQKIITTDRLYLKTQLVNSRFLLDSNFQLELHLAIASYLIKENIKFIYPYTRYLNEEKTQYITVYYLIY